MLKFCISEYLVPSEFTKMYFWGDNLEKNVEMKHDNSN